MTRSPQDLIVEWLDELPQDRIGDGKLELYAAPPATVVVWSSWQPITSSSTMSDPMKLRMAARCVRHAESYLASHPSLSVFELVWSHEGITTGLSFQMPLVPWTNLEGTNSPTVSSAVCPDCKGSKKYVGILETTPCYTCQGGGPS